MPDQAESLTPDPDASQPAAPGGSTTGKHLGLGAGGAVENSFQNAPLVMGNPIYNVGLGVDPTVVGIALALPRIWELVLDPIIGAASDRTTGRLGRRLPYMIGGLLGSFLFFVAIWFAPSGWSHGMLGAWLVVTSLLFYTAYSFFAVPYAALTIDATRAGADRIGVMTVRAAMAGGSGLVMGWLYWLCQREWFSSPVEGMRWVGIGFGFLVLLFGVWVVWTTLRLGLHQETPVEHLAGESPAHAARYRDLLRLGSLRRLLVALFSIMLGFLLVSHLGFYLVAYYACGGDLKYASLVMGAKGTIAVVVGTLACPAIGALAKRLGRAPVFNSLLAIGLAGTVSTWFLVTPANPWLSIGSDILVAIGLNGFWLLMPAYLGDVADVQETARGMSCQGALAALYGNAVKIGASLALLLTGYVLVVCGFHADMGQEAMGQPIFWMRLLYATIPALGILLAFFAMRKFNPHAASESAIP
jgi:GPH family glycoside/pentoside/hexuronide:cation symporter